MSHSDSNTCKVKGMLHQQKQSKEKHYYHIYKKESRNIQTTIYPHTQTQTQIHIKPPRATDTANGYTHTHSLWLHKHSIWLHAHSQSLHTHSQVWLHTLTQVWLHPHSHMWLHTQPNMATHTAMCGYKTIQTPLVEFSTREYMQVLL